MKPRHRLFAAVTLMVCLVIPPQAVSAGVQDVGFMESGVFETGASWSGCSADGVASGLTKGSPARYYALQYMMVDEGLSDDMADGDLYNARGRLHLCGQMAETSNPSEEWLVGQGCRGRGGKGKITAPGRQTIWLRDVRWEGVIGASEVGTGAGQAVIPIVADAVRASTAAIAAATPTQFYFVAWLQIWNGGGTPWSPCKANLLANTRGTFMHSTEDPHDLPALCRTGWPDRCLYGAPGPLG